MNLIEMAKMQSHRTDKYDLGYINEFYSSLFEPLQTSATAILEIGIYQGNSIKLWRDYFKNATVYGADINFCKSLEGESRVITKYGNAYVPSFASTFPDNSFDVVIDDGPHTLDSMFFFLENYIQKVKPGGLLILEDIIDRSWTPKLMNCIDSSMKVCVHDMRNKQLTPELTNRWRNGLDVIVVQK